jgi:hypothetical protein
MPVVTNAKAGSWGIGRLVRRADLDQMVAMLLLFIGGTAFYACTYDRSAYDYILRADEGVSFATAMRAMQGFIPQRDFPSYYGPVMPYVYGGALTLFGTSIAVMRAFWAFLDGISVLLFFQIGRKLLPNWVAFIVAAMVIGQLHPPLYTYNHIGLVLAIQGMLLLVLSAMPEGPPRYFSVTFSALLLLAMLIKFNEAVVAFAAVVIFLWICGLYRRDLSTRSPEMIPVPLRAVVVPGMQAFLLFVTVTIILNARLTKSQFLRNFPLLPQYQASIGGYKYVALLLSIPFKTPFRQLTSHDWSVLWYDNYVFAILASFLLAILFVVTVVHFIWSREYRRSLDLCGWRSGLVLTLAVGAYHEFYSTGNHWSTPMYIGFSLLAITCVAWNGFPGFSRTKYALLFALLAVCITSDVYYVSMVRRDYSQFYLDSPRARIYSSLDSDAPVVREIVEFLDQTPDAGQSLAAFPHDALLIYLAGRRNALRDDDYQWMLFPTEKSDDEIVQEIAHTKVAHILLSNFVGIRHGEPAVFGRDYLTHTFRYLQDHYQVVRTFGSDPRGYQVQYLELYVPPTEGQLREDIGTARR